MSDDELQLQKYDNLVDNETSQIGVSSIASTGNIVNFSNDIETLPYIPHVENKGICLVSQCFGCVILVKYCTVR